MMICASCSRAATVNWRTHVACMEVSLSSPLLLWIISHPRRPHEGVRMDDQSGSLHEGIHRQEAFPNLRVVITGAVW